MAGLGRAGRSSNMSIGALLAHLRHWVRRAIPSRTNLQDPMRHLFLLLVCCLAAGCNPQVRAGAMSQTGVCLRVLQFEDASARNLFLAENATTIADRFNPQGTLYLQTDSPVAMRVAVLAANCQQPDELAPLTRTAGISVVRAQFVRTLDVANEFATEPGFVSDGDERECIVVANAAASDRRFGLILSGLSYGGVRFRQVLGVEERTFIASDESCDLTVKLVDAVSHEIGLTSATAQVCQSHTLRECVAMTTDWPND